MDIPNAGQNRINTVHFFAEAEKKGSGPAAVRRVLERDFGVKIPYYVRIRFDGVVKVVDALGGLTITLPEAQAGYEAAPTHWTVQKRWLLFVTAKDLMIYTACSADSWQSKRWPRKCSIH